jgi:hypothetical protein
MFSVHHKEYDHKIKETKGKHFIWDAIRKKWIQITPEEWVRQNFIQYLIIEKGYPKESIAVEKQIITHENKSRFDIVVYDNKMQPWMIVECKNQNIPLDDKVVQQILNYQSIVQCKYLIVTNGNAVAGWQISDGTKVITELPDYC